MKKFSVLFLACLMSLSIQAQIEHMKFMGIPIDGKISAFQKQIKKKGFCPDRKYNILPKEFFASSRPYIGYFAGEDNAHLLVSFNNKTKIVYEVKVIIDCISENELLSKYTSFCSDYKNKYETSIIKDLKDASPSNGQGISIYVPDKEKDTPIGLITILKEANDIEKKYNLVIQYWDITNLRSSSLSDVDDL